MRAPAKYETFEFHPFTFPLPGGDQAAIGDGVNAENMRKCLAILRDNNYTGVLSMEREGQSASMIKKSLAQLRKTLTDPKIEVEG